MENWNEQLLEVIKRGREERELNHRNELAVKHEMAYAAKERERLNSSKAAAVAVVTPCQMMVSNNPDRNSKAASVSVQRPNKAKIIADFISNGH